LLLGYGSARNARQPSYKKAFPSISAEPRSRVSFFMNKFRKLGLIDYNGSIEIHSSLLNVVLRDQPQINR
jgi:hypothetical protein